MSARLSGFDRGLTLWILAAMGLGVALGASVPGWSELLGRATVRGVNVPIAIGLMAMLLPPLAHVRYRALPGMFRRPRILAISLVLNWIIGPALMFCLAAWWLPDRPDLFAGVVLIGIARCIAMVLVWNDLAGEIGNSRQDWWPSIPSSKSSPSPHLLGSTSPSSPENWGYLQRPLSFPTGLWPNRLPSISAFRLCSPES